MICGENVFELKRFGSGDLPWLDAVREAEDNWSRWAMCYEARPDIVGLGENPILAERHLFQSFLYEYSVSRGYKMKSLDVFRVSLLHMDNPRSIQDVLSVADGSLVSKPRADGTPRAAVSLASKLLGSWRPEEFPMWDGFARAGLRKLVRPARGNSWNDTSCAGYENYKAACHFLRDELVQELEIHLPATMKGKAGATDRLLDNVLLAIGR